MDQKRTAHSMALIVNNLPTAQLLIGPHPLLLQKVNSLLQQLWCTKKGCSHCITCTKIKKKQHHAIKWYYPEKFYTLEEIDSILSTIAFKLNKREHFFFIIQKADFLTTACANRLLKSIEEPPPGYHFLLLAERKEQLLPTIRSRCVIKLLHIDSTADHHSDLLSCFTVINNNSPASFLKILEQSKINERETIELLDKLLVYWTKQYKKAITKQDNQEIEQTTHLLSIITDTTKNSPMPGSSKLFLRNLYLQISIK